MKDIYSLFKNDLKLSPDDMILLLDRISSSNIFDSAELVDYLDKCRRGAPLHLIKRIKAFQRSTINLELEQQEIREFALN